MWRIGERGEPWGMPLLAAKLGVVWSSKDNVVNLFSKKLVTRRTMFSGTRLHLKLWVSRVAFTLGKACEMSRKRTEVTSCDRCVSLTILVTVVVLPGLAPNWFAGSRACISARLDSLRVMTASQTLPRVSSSAIGRYAFGMV